MAASENWTEPHRCPFCDAELASPGEGFVIHVDESPECKARFERWRNAVSNDMRGGWSG